MTDRKRYSGIDYFRVIAAVLIIAIHTSPLGSYSATGDFILTRIIARVAVPFFFMTSGYFLISKYTYNAGKLWAFAKKTAIIYLVAVVIYIPINVYNGYFKMDNLLANIVKDVLVDGTLYHLWYLPASIVGAAIAWYLVKKCDYKIAFVVTGILYVIGLFGDSYYGISKKLSAVEGFYDLIFQVTDYTRNGLFFAPIFFILGGYISEQSKKCKFKNSIIGFVISFTAMVAEAMTLHHFDLQLHDSMYVFLPLCMYYLFSAILHFNGKRIVELRTISLVMYIIHPFVIVAVRLAAKIVHLEKLLIDNSIIHFIVVCMASVVCGIIMAYILKKNKKKPLIDDERSYMEIDLENLEHNVKVLKEAMPDHCELMAVVKAEAYGHGMFEIAKHVDKIGVKAYAVATVDEGVKLRQYGIRGDILILGYTSPALAKVLHKYDLTQTLIDYEYASLLNEQKHTVKVHIKIDTGMHRLGFDANNIDDILKALDMKYINVTGIFTHLCAADSLETTDVDFTHQQIDRFKKVLETLKEKGIKIPKVHIQSSYGLLNYPELDSDYVRVGIALYGVLSALHDKVELNLDLRPVLSLKSKVALIRTVKKGESIGYSRTFVTERDSKIAILPIGYADGYPRNLSGGKAYVLINGKKAPIVGRICMDQMAVDVTDIDDIKVGMTATLIGKDGEHEITATMVSEGSETITNELLSRMGQRLHHRIK